MNLLQDLGSGVQIAFVTAGAAEPDTLSGIFSLGTIDYLPIWLFYVSSERLVNLSQLKGKRIALGPVGSGTRFSAEKILGKGGINAQSAIFVPLASDKAAQALGAGEVDVVWILGSPNASAAQEAASHIASGLLSIPMDCTALLRSKGHSRRSGRCQSLRSPSKSRSQERPFSSKVGAVYANSGIEPAGRLRDYERGRWKVSESVDVISQIFIAGFASRVIASVRCGVAAITLPGLRDRLSCRDFARAQGVRASIAFLQSV